MAAKEPPDPVELRSICERSSIERIGYPSPAHQAASLVRSLWDWAISGFTVATDEEQAARRAICHECPEWVVADRRCRLCGCYTDAKLRLRTERCPIGRW